MRTLRAVALVWTALGIGCTPDPAPGDDTSDTGSPFVSSLALDASSFCAAGASVRAADRSYAAVQCFAPAQVAPAAPMVGGSFSLQPGPVWLVNP